MDAPTDPNLAPNTHDFKPGEYRHVKDVYKEHLRDKFAGDALVGCVFADYDTPNIYK